MPINDEPASDITDRTSAKSTFTKPGTCKAKKVEATCLAMQITCNCHTAEYFDEAYVKNVSISRLKSFQNGMLSSKCAKQITEEETKCTTMSIYFHSVASKANGEYKNEVDNKASV